METWLYITLAVFIASATALLIALYLFLAKQGGVKKIHYHYCYLSLTLEEMAKKWLPKVWGAFVWPFRKMKAWKTNHKAKRLARKEKKANLRALKKEAREKKQIELVENDIFNQMWATHMAQKRAQAEKDAVKILADSPLTRNKREPFDGNPDTFFSVFAIITVLGEMLIVGGFGMWGLWTLAPPIVGGGLACMASGSRSTERAQAPHVDGTAYRAAQKSLTEKGY